MEDEERYGIAELAEAAGVSVRTVRYYIAEGLLPPPVTAGARSYYSREHLDRLLVIGRLKDAFLPLREIRRHLAGLDEATIQQLAAEVEPDAAFALGEEWPVYAPVPEAAEPSPAPPAIAQEERPSFSAQLAEPMTDARRRSSASEYIARVLGSQGGAHLSVAPAARVPKPQPHRPPSASTPEISVVWRRIEIGEEAELLIREDVYQRRLDKVDWLVEWARKVLG